MLLYALKIQGRRPLLGGSAAEQEALQEAVTSSSSTRKTGRLGVLFREPLRLGPAVSPSLWFGFRDSLLVTASDHFQWYDTRSMVTIWVQEKTAMGIS